MKKTIIFVLAIFAGVLAHAENSSEWVKVADQIRNPSESYTMKIKVEDGSEEHIYEVFLKGQNQTLIVTKEPARDKGRNMLMQERDFQSYIPNLKRSMKLSLSQKLSGQVANGDISRTRWFGDYDVRVDAASKDPKTDLLILKANKPNLTYEWIHLKLEKKTHRPVEAEYIGLNGKTILKKATFLDYKTMEGAERPTTLKIQDPAGQTSFIRIQAMQKKDLADSFFTVRNMETLR